MEAKRPSQVSQPEAPPAVQEGLEDRLGRLLAGTGDDLPPLEETAPPPQVREALAPTVTATAPPVESPTPVVQQAPASVVEAPTTPAVETAPQAPLMLVPRPITNLTAGEKRDASMEAELYSILVTMQHLEMAFVKGCVPNEEYEKHCGQTVTQFKTLQKALEKKIPDIRVFIKEHNIDCELASERLLGTGVSATQLHGAGTSSGGAKEARAFASTTEHFVTLMNAMQLNYSSCEQLLPLVQELQTSIVSIPSHASITGLDRITNWLVTLNNMGASDILSENQLKQLSLDVELSYTSFKNYVQNM